MKDELGKKGIDSGYLYYVLEYIWKNINSDEKGLV
jgi:hypothetical protein